MAQNIINYNNCTNQCDSDLNDYNMIKNLKVMSITASCIDDSWRLDRSWLYFYELKVGTNLYTNLNAEVIPAEKK
jgi:hypothetical protein